MPRILIARFMHETNTFSRVKTEPGAQFEPRQFAVTSAPRVAS
jgi:hypothetical protein